MNALKEVLLGCINLFLFWGIRVGNNLYSVWGGINDTGSVYSLFAVFQSAKKDARALFALLQYANKGDVRAIGFIGAQLTPNSAIAFVGIGLQLAEKQNDIAILVGLQIGNQVGAAIILGIQIASSAAAVVLLGLQTGDAADTLLVLVGIQHAREYGADAPFVIGIQYAVTFAHAIAVIGIQATTRGSSDAYFSLLQFYGKGRERGVALIASVKTDN